MNILLLPHAAKHKTSVVLEDATQIRHIQQVLGLDIGDDIKIGIEGDKLGMAVIDEATAIKDSACHTPNGTASGQPSPYQRCDEDSQARQVAGKRLGVTDIQCDTMPPEKLDLTIVLALPRPKVLRRLIMDMTAIGVRHIVLVNSYRTHKSYWQSPMLSRLDEFVKEGLQQGVDTILPKIELQQRFKPFVEDKLSQLTKDMNAVVAYPYAEVSFNEFISQQSLPQIICIGAEGGWIDYEVNLLVENGCLPVSLGQRILRTEAAVNVLCGRYL